MMNDSVERRRKRVRYRCHHRGSKEADLLLGGFAERYLAMLTGEQLERFEALLETGDPDLYAWATAREPVPPDKDTDVMRLLRDHAAKRSPA